MTGDGSWSIPDAWVDRIRADRTRPPAMGWREPRPLSSCERLRGYVDMAREVVALRICPWLVKAEDE